ncbi:30S ribosomal protein S13 [Patescibacteria group bacterium]|nr:30S ribosomal protein S13 [Patescibacteria group bacterium]
MARIAGVSLPQTKRVDVALTYIYGIGETIADRILEKTGIAPETRVKDLTEAQANKLREEVEKNNKVEGELRREVLSHIKRLKEIGSYRGSRHIKGLPARGQRTKTNSRTIRGNVRRTTGSGKRKLEKT